MFSMFLRFGLCDENFERICSRFLICWVIRIFSRISWYFPEFMTFPGIHGISRNSWHFPEFHGISRNSWHFPEFHGISQNFMAFPRIPGISQNSMAFPGIHGISQNFMGITRIPWESPEFQQFTGIPWYFPDSDGAKSKEVAYFRHTSPPPSLLELNALHPPYSNKEKRLYALMANLYIMQLWRLCIVDVERRRRVIACYHG